jgi:hypothetical protein
MNELKLFVIKHPPHLVQIFTLQQIYIISGFIMYQNINKFHFLALQMNKA